MQSQFKRWKERYELGWARKDQLERLVTAGILTRNEFNEIVKVYEIEEE